MGLDLAVVKLLKADLGCSGVCFWAIYFGNGRFFGMLGVGPWSFERGTYLCQFFLKRWGFLWKSVCLGVDENWGGQIGKAKNGYFL